MTTIEEPDWVAVERAESLAKRIADLADEPAPELEQRANGRSRPTESPAVDVRSRLIPGGSFILDSPETVPAVWGRDDQVLWAKGEPLIIAGPPGTGKTTLTGQVLHARLGFSDEALGLPVEPTSSRVLYLASDRPKQIGRALRRLFHDVDRQTLDERLVFWKGPPPGDLARKPATLAYLCAQAGADTVILDSLKDMAVGISDDEVGSGINQAIQMAIAADIEVLTLHHQRKGQSGTKPKTLEDVYGSTWITAGAGSVVLLWGSAGDSIVELVHLKQPAAQVGPWKIEHDHHAGRSSVTYGFDALRWLRLQPAGGTAPEAARAMTEKASPTDNERKRAQRLLDALVRKDLAKREDAVRGGDGGAQPARYTALDDTHQETS
jgi:replicative DNA helicase